MLKVKLQRDLRKNLLRGHPWVYQQAIIPPKADKAQLCEVIDKKNQSVGWAIYDPHSPLALRMMSLAKKPPNKNYWASLFQKAYQQRESLRSDETQAYRLFNGEGDRLPGLGCDVYHKTAVIQFDGQGPFEFWDQDFIASWLLETTACDQVIFKPRYSDNKDPRFWGRPDVTEVTNIKENGLTFLVNILEGQKTGFFLDQRDNRQYVKQISKGLSTLNLFSYSGGFSIYAGAGGANSVTSVDLSQGALDLAQQAWEKNNLSQGQHETISTDVFDFLESEKRTWDLVIVDPPSMTHSEKQKDKAIQSYIELFAQSIKRTKSHICFSSCSSHISFNDFLMIIDEAMSKARKNGRTLRISGQGADHPIPHSCREFRYLKFVHVILD